MYKINFAYLVFLLFLFINNFIAHMGRNDIDVQKMNNSLSIKFTNLKF